MVDYSKLMHRSVTRAFPGSLLLLLALLGVIWGFGILLISSTHVLLFAISAAVLSFSLWLMQKAVRVFDLTRLTFPGFTYISYVTMIWLPAFFIYFQITPANSSFKIYPGAHLATYLFAAQSILITVPVGMLIINKLLLFKTDEIDRYYSAPIDETVASISWPVYAMFLSGALMLTFMYFRNLGSYPVVEMFGNAEWKELAELREETGTAMESQLVYAFSVLKEAIYPLLVVIALGYYMLKRRLGWLLLFLGVSVLAITFASISISRGGVATIVLVMASFVYLYKGGIISTRYLVAAPLLIFSFPILVTLNTNVMTLWDALRTIGIRIFYTPAYVAYVYYEIIPSEVDYLYGATSGKIAWLFGLDHFNTGLYVLQHTYADAPLSGSAGGAFHADFYANFGMYGVLFGGVFMGALLQGIQIYLLRSKKTIGSLAVFAFMFYGFWMTTSRPLPTVLLSTGVAFVFLTWWILTGLPEVRNLKGWVRRSTTRNPRYASSLAYLRKQGRWR